MSSSRLFLTTLALCLGSTTPVAAQEHPSLRITNGPVIEDVSDTTAQIAWSTHASSGTVVHYGTDPMNLDQTASMPWGALTHRVEIKGLKPKTTYYFKAESDQGQGTGGRVETMESSFETKASGMQGGNSSVQATLMAGPVVQAVKDTSVQLWWLASRPGAATSVKYGTDPTAVNLAVPATVDNSGASGEFAQLTNLQPNTKYSFKVIGQDGEVLGSGEFRTEPANYESSKNVWITKGPTVEAIASTSAEVIWSTNVRSSSVVHYGVDPRALNQTAAAIWEQDGHRVLIKDLRADTRYYFQVESGESQAGNMQIKSPPTAFQTLGKDQQANTGSRPR